MATLSDERIRQLLEVYSANLTAGLVSELSVYLDLLMKWNSRTNLTAIREPEEMVRVHFGEALFTADQLPPGETLLDFGSGAGFPGMPIALARVDLRVTLAESQNKKAAFLCEVVRTLGVAAEVWPKRVEDLPQDRQFDFVTLRAVDEPVLAMAEAYGRVRHGGFLVSLGTSAEGAIHSAPIPGTRGRFVSLRENPGA